MIVSIFTRFFLVFFMLFLAGCASNSTDPEIAFRGQSPSQIYQTGRQAFLKRDDAAAIKAYEALNVLYPMSLYSQSALLDLMTSYQRQGDAANTEKTAEHFIRFYSDSSSLDYAYYMIALAHLNQDRGWYLRHIPMDSTQRDPGTMRQAYSDFKNFIQKFPNSPYYADAQRRLRYLRSVFSQYELHIADFYFRKQSYVAAANRAADIIHQYPETPAAKTAHHILHESYRALNVSVLEE